MQPKPEHGLVSTAKPILDRGRVLVSQDERRIEVRTRDGQEWLTQIGGAGQTVRVHGRELSVDTIYG